MPSLTKIITISIIFLPKLTKKWREDVLECEEERSTKFICLLTVTYEAWNRCYSSISNKLRQFIDRKNTDSPLHRKLGVKRD